MDTAEILKLVEILIWPFTIIIGVFIIRKYLPLIVDKLKGFSAFGFEITLTQANEYSPDYADAELNQAKTNIDNLPSYVSSLEAEFMSQGEYDFAVVYIGQGNKWLTSRLYIFSIMLSRMRNLQCWVFVEPAKGLETRFLGLANPKDVRWSLAKKYPWFETAYLKALYDDGNSKQINSLSGGMADYEAKNTVYGFLSEIQNKGKPEENKIENIKEWLELPKSKIWERAKWIDSSYLKNLLGDSLIVDSMPFNIDLPKKEKVKMVLRRKGNYIAMVDKDYNFKGLIKRKPVVEEVISKLADQ